MEEKWKVMRKWNVIAWKGILFLFTVSWHHSTLLQTHWASVSLKCCPVWFVFVYILTACVFLTRDTVRHPRRLVFGKFVLKPNCSWTEVWLYLSFCIWANFVAMYMAVTLYVAFVKYHCWNLGHVVELGYVKNTTKCVQSNTEIAHFHM